MKDFPGGTVVKNPPSNAGDVGSIPGWGTKLPLATVRETHVPQQRPSAAREEKNEIPPHPSQNGHH